MSPPYKPMIPDAVIIRHDGVLIGDIKPGEVFAWNPDIPHARELVIVSTIDNGSVGSWDMDYKRLYFNDERTFREVCFRTKFNLFPARPPKQ